MDSDNVTSSDSQNNDDNQGFDDLEQWLAGQDGSGPPLWDPQPGDTLVGTFLRYETRYSQKIGGETKVAIIEDRQKQLHAVWLSRGVLAGEYDRQNPQPGDDMGHKYHGWKEPRGGGKAYHNYTVRKMSNRGPSAPPPPSPATPPPPPPQPATPVAAGTGSDDDIPL